MWRKIVYIDSQNIHASTQELWWIVDWGKFHIYMQQKYNIDECKIFFWYIQKYDTFYEKLRNIGYTVIFKKVLILPNWETKWNVDIDIAIHAILDIFENNLWAWFLVTWDWDYNTLVDTLKQKQLLGKVIIPNKEKSSKLLRRSAGAHILTLEQIKYFLEKQKS